MGLMQVKGKRILIIAVAVAFAVLAFAPPTMAKAMHKFYHGWFKAGLQDGHVKCYEGGEDGGLAHITYWGLIPGNPYYDALEPEEQAKAGKINVNVIHSKLFDPPIVGNPDIAGIEVTGKLKFGKRVQSITFRIPENWNHKLVVAGTPGLRNEYANEAILVPWLLDQGYAYIAGDKGIPGGATDMTSGNHPTQYWGKMMIDMALWAKRCLRLIKWRGHIPIYTIGLSNGGYQVRRAMEIDHERVNKGRRRLFDGGVDWSGAYWQDERVMDTNLDGKVSVAEYAATNSLIGSIDKAMLAMGWAYPDGNERYPVEFDKSPPFPDAYLSFIDGGFSAESGVFWGYYNTIFDPFQYLGLPNFRGVGYYNLVSYVYRADLRGDDPVESAKYSCYSDPANPDVAPPIYEWLSNDPDGGWNKTSVKYALKNANTGEFSAPLLSLHGLADGLVALHSMGLAYKQAVEKYGSPDYYRFYGIGNAGHVDYHADGGGDFDFNGKPGDEEMADLLTPMQAYAQRTFYYMIDWVENGEEPPGSKVVPTDPENDISDPNMLEW